MTEHPPVRAVVATFPSMDTLINAAQWLRAAGYRELELYSPYPPEHADEVLELKRPNIPAFVLLAGLAGAALGLFAQWYTNAWDYPINVGGRPLNSFPAWVPITFELAVLFAAFGAVLSFLISSGLPRFWRPLFELDGFARVSTDGFWLAIAATDPHLDPERAQDELRSLGAERVQTFEEPT